MGPCASKDTAAETKYLWIVVLQPHSPGTNDWWESLALPIQNRNMFRNVIKVLRGQPHADYIHDCKHRKSLTSDI